VAVAWRATRETYHASAVERFRTSAAITKGKLLLITQSAFKSACTIAEVKQSIAFLARLFSHKVQLAGNSSTSPNVTWPVMYVTFTRSTSLDYVFNKSRSRSLRNHVD
jgi:hypothetical protein